MALVSVVPIRRISVLGIDPSITKTGFALLPDSKANPKHIYTGSFSASGVPDPVDRWCREMWDVLEQFRPDLVVFERALEFSPNYGEGSNSGQLMLNKLDGAIRAMCVAMDVLYEDVRPATWRKWALGKGDYDRDEAKRAAKARCKMLGIKIANVDEAEAALICLYGTSVETLRMLARG